MSDLKIFTENIEPEALNQVYTLVKQPAFADCKVRIMPDVHAGAGCVIGFTADLGDKVIPNIVGVDIGCFVGETKIPLLNGKQKTLKELYEENKEFWVYSIDENQHITAGRAVALKTRKDAELVKVTISGGETICCTPDHKFMLRDGLYKKAIDLQYKDSLMPLYRSYKTRDGYEYISEPNGATRTKSIQTHKSIYKDFYGDILNGYVVHHINLNQYDNTPENLQLMTSKEHSKLHGLNNKRRLISDDFKNSRIESLKINGYYNPIYKEKKREVATKNIVSYMEEHQDEYQNVVKENGKRGKKFLIDYNKSEKGRQKSKEISNRCYKCDICGGMIKSPIGLYNHKKKEHNNHKVIKVEKLDYTEDVYCLNVEKYHNFALGAGVFVHNCGMLCVQLSTKDIDLQKLDDVIRKYVPNGREVHEGRKVKFDKLQDLYCYRNLRDTKRIERSIGTLGGGNHFIEIDSDDDGNKYLVIHSGSRNLGKQVAEYYQNMAVEIMQGKDDLLEKQEKLIAEYKASGRRNEIQKAIKELRRKFNPNPLKIPKELSYLTGKYREEYLHDMKICQEYAIENRSMMADIILDKMHLSSEFAFETIHNYIEHDTNMIRKGAVSAKKDQLLLIPINMRDGCIVAKGKGNDDWNQSAPHGAGRIMSRSKAKENVDFEEYKKSMEGIFTTSVQLGTIDESPMVYKPMEEIIENIKDTVEIVKIIKPIYNFKACE